MARKTIAYWIRKFGYTLDVWNAYTNRFGQAGLFFSCIGPDKSEHEFYF
jgi:hypothetical protein